MSHAFLSASGSSRWLACPPSAHLETDFPEQISTFAEDGTLAHNLAELMLKKELYEISEKNYAEHFEKIKADAKFDQEMFNHITNYSEVVLERIAEAKALSKSVMVLIEDKLDFSEWVPKGYGTGDVVIISNKSIEIIDLKYGKGVAVKADNNSQMRLYALGAYNNYGFIYDIENIRTTIIQPRLDSISSEELSTEELLAWGTEIKAIADLAYNGEGEFNSGEHCKFCKAKYLCRKLAEDNLELARHEFKHAELLTDDEVVEILNQTLVFQNWIKSVGKYALDQAVNHQKVWPGMKLVEGRSVRKFKDIEKVVILLDDPYKPQELKSITEIEKDLGRKKFQELLGEFIIKPEGKPTLARADDKRPELKSVESAKIDFEEEYED